MIQFNTETGVSTTVSVPELRAALALVLDKEESMYGTQFEPAADTYWDLPVSEAFELQLDPASATLTVGSLRDDVETVSELAAVVGDQKQVFVRHDLAHIVGILRAIVAMDLP